MLSKSIRVRRGVDWKKMHRNARTLHSPWIAVRFMRNHLDKSRFGFLVSNKVSKRANVRNKVRRRLSYFVKTNLLSIKPGYDIIFITRPRILELDYQQIARWAKILLSKANIYEYRKD